MDSSDDEIVSEPLKITWFDDEQVGGKGSLAISELPGGKCYRSSQRRSLDDDIASLQQIGVTDVFVLNTASELKRLKVGNLLEVYTAASIVPHDYSLEDGTCPDNEYAERIVLAIYGCLMKSRKVVVHCRGGLGRAGTVAAILLRAINPKLTAQEAIEAVRQLRGNAAVQTVKQYNFVSEFSISPDLLNSAER